MDILKKSVNWLIYVYKFINYINLMINEYKRVWSN